MKNILINFDFKKKSNTGEDVFKNKGHSNKNIAKLNTRPNNLAHSSHDIHTFHLSIRFYNLYVVGSLFCLFLSFHFIFSESQI